MESKLNYQPSTSEKREYILRRALGKIAQIPGMKSLSRLLLSLATRIDNFHNVEKSYQLYIERKNRLDSTGMLGHEVGSSFGYQDDFHEIKMAAYYRAQIENGNLETQKTESGAVYADAIERVSSALKDHPEIKTVTNFGVSYGYIDSELAKHFPDVNFYGVDRSKVTKMYNDNVFDLPNLHFVAGDIFEHISIASKQGPSLLLHIRTNTLLPETFVRQLYSKAQTFGVKVIVGLEQCGISWETGLPYVFSINDDKPSILFRNTMQIHNYPGILKAHGFSTVSEKLLKTNHPDGTYRIAAFTAYAD